MAFPIQPVPVLARGDIKSPRSGFSFAILPPVEETIVDNWRCFTLKPNLRNDKGYATRRARRDAIKIIVAHIAAIREAEQSCLDKVPENFQSSESFEIGERAVETLDEIIDLLGDVF